MPVPPGDTRQLDLIMPNLNVARGLPLFCDLTIISPISRNGNPRSGTSNSGGKLLERADIDNRRTYAPVLDSGLRTLYCLGCKVYGRWSESCVELVPELARERCRGLNSRVRRGAALSLEHRWWGILSLTLQKAVASTILLDYGADLHTALLEPAPTISELPSA